MCFCVHISWPILVFIPLTELNGRNKTQTQHIQFSLNNFIIKTKHNTNKKFDPNQKHFLFNNGDLLILLLLLDLVLGVRPHELPGVEDQDGAGDESADQVNDGHHRAEDVDLRLADS